MLENSALNIFMKRIVEHKIVVGEPYEYDYIMLNAMYITTKIIPLLNSVNKN